MEENIPDTAEEITPEPEEETTPEETVEDDSAGETEEETTPETEPESYAGVKPLADVSEVLSFHDGESEWTGTADLEDLERRAEETAENAKIIQRADVRRSKAYREIALALLLFRSTVMVKRSDGSIGPDWSGLSSLSRRYTALTVSKPLASLGADRGKIVSVQNQIGVYMGRKVPGQDYTLRDQFIREWASDQLNLAGETFNAGDIEKRVDSESKATGLKSAAMSRVDRQGNTAGPDDRGPKSPLPALTVAVAEITSVEQDIPGASLVIEAHKLLTKLALQVRKHDGRWADKQRVLEAFKPFYGLVIGLQENLDGEQETWTAIDSNLFGAAAKSAAVEIATNLAKASEETAQAS